MKIFKVGFCFILLLLWIVFEIPMSGLGMRACSGWLFSLKMEDLGWLGLSLGFLTNSPLPVSQVHKFSPDLVVSPSVTGLKGNPGFIMLSVINPLESVTPKL